MSDYMYLTLPYYPIQLQLGNNHDFIPVAYHIDVTMISFKFIALKQVESRWQSFAQEFYRD